MEEQKFAQSVHETTHSHTWMITLLIGCLALVVALGGLFAYKYYQPQEIEIAEVSQTIEEVNQAVAETEIFKGSEIQPTFEYPVGWHVYSSVGQFSGTVIHSIVSNKPILIGEGEDFFPITITTYLKSDLLNGQTETEYIDLLENRDPMLNKWEIKAGQLNGADVYTVLGESDFGNYEFEQILYFGKTYVTSIYYTRVDENLDSDWTTFKSSLDLNGVK